MPVPDCAKELGGHLTTIIDDWCLTHFRYYCVCVQEALEKLKGEEGAADDGEKKEKKEKKKDKVRRGGDVECA